MGQHAGQRDRRGAVEDAGDLQKLGAVRGHAAALVPDVDLDEHGVGGAVGRDRLGRVGVVGDDLEVGALVAEGRRAIELGGRHADGIEDVGDAVVEKIGRLAQGGDGDAAEVALERKARGLGRLGGLEVGPQAHPEAAHARGHRPGVGGEHAAVEDERGGREVVEVHAELRCWGWRAI